MAKALRTIIVLVFAPIDKISLAFTILMAAFILKERITTRTAVGVILQVDGALLTLWAP